MIEARHTLSGKWLADFCSGPYMVRHFRQVDITGEADAGECPLLMFANHFSWWDGFIQYRLNRKIFGRKLYVMMLEEQLEKYKILNRCGCFSVRKNSRSAVQTLNYAAGLLSDPRNMVLVFPQGGISSVYSSRISFESGTQYLMKLIRNDYRIVFNVNLIDYGPYKKPALRVYHRTIDPSSLTSLQVLENTYNDFYRECLDSHSSGLW